jgi:hypothetical protein
MIGIRSLRSLAQYLELQDREFVSLMLEKHGLCADLVFDHFGLGTGYLTRLVESLDARSEPQLSASLNEIARTSGDLRNRVTPRYRYDERFADLKLGLGLQPHVRGWMLCWSSKMAQRPLLGCARTLARPA